MCELSGGVARDASNTPQRYQNVSEGSLRCSADGSTAGGATLDRLCRALGFLPENLLSRFAMSFRSTAVTCWYRLAMALFDHPMKSITARSGAPRRSSTVAAVWRAS